jgi:predicted permease
VNWWGRLRHRDDLGGLTRLEHAVQDARYAVRSFGRTPGFTVAAILTLALGIGATTAIFSVVSATLLRPLPYQDADRLVRIVEHVPAEESPSGLPLRTSAMNQDAFLWWRDQTKTLAGLAASLTASMTVPIGADTLRLTGARVSPSLFAMLGVRPLAGRVLTVDDEPHAKVAVLGAATWARYFSSDPHIIGRPISLDGVPHIVVGVVPADFDFPSPHTELWTPYLVEPNGPNRILTVDVLARLRDGVPIAAASTEANEIGNGFLGLPPPGATGAPGPPRFEVAGLQDELVEPIRPALRVLMASVSVVLLIVCANVANLLMARGSTRRRELGIRRALGAGRGRLIRQILTESVVLSTAGAVAGTGLAFAGLRVLKTLTAITLPALYGGNNTLLPGIEHVSVDHSVLTFTLLVCLGTGLVFGLMPALHLSDVALPHTSGHAAASGITRARSGARRMLTVSQLALATMLLVGAALLIHSFVNLSSVDLGYSPSGALTFELVLPQQVPGIRKLALANELAARLTSLPHVEAAGFTGAAPLSTMQGGYVLTPPGTTPGLGLAPRRGREQRASLVSPDYLRAIGVRLVEGRWLDAHDGLDQPRAMLVNRALARQFFGDKSPLGLPVAIGDVPWQVVGVVSDVRYRSIDANADPQAYVDPVRINAFARAAGWEKYGFEPAPLFVSFAVRVGGNPTSIVPDVRRLARQLDPLATVDGAVAMEQIVSGSLARPRFYAVVLGLFAGVAAVLAAIGIYGLLAYAVTLRTQEIGIRMALGAEPGQVVGLVFREGGVLTAIGIAIGVAAAVGLTRYLRGMLFGLTPLDAPTYVVVCAAFAVVACVASWVPARRATSVDPLAALRAE